MARVLARHTSEVLRPKDWNVGEEPALALFVFAAHIFVLYVVEIVLFVAVAAEALTGGSNGLAVGARLHIAPIHIEAVLSLLAHTSLVRLELGLAHHLAAVVVANDSVVLQVGLHVPRRLVVHH